MLVVLGIVCALLGGTANATDPKFLTITCGGSSGSWYVGGAIMSEIFNTRYPKLRLTPVPGGGVTNMKVLQAGKAEFGFMFISTCAQALKGTGPFEGKKLGKLRAVMALAPMHMHLIVHDASGIKSYRDLEGKRVCPGKKGFTGAATFLALIKEYGMSVESIKKKGGNVLWLDYSDSAQSMRDRLIDAIFSTSSIPHAPYTELASVFKMRFIPIDEKIIKSFPKSNPGWSPGFIPPGSYPGVDKPVRTMVDSMAIGTRADASEETVYKFTKAVYEERQKLIEGYPAYKKLGPDVVVTEGLKSLPIHPGAAKYWKEIGLLK
jgi:TRAP transporter TAXI family solute receptor